MKITKIREERRDFTIDFIEFKMVISEYYDIVYTNKLNNPDEIDKKKRGENPTKANK
jgi:hypothetical protein